jgi:hypothetical protein
LYFEMTWQGLMEISHWLAKNTVNWVPLSAAIATSNHMHQHSMQQGI